jgi:hypothetical protein
LILAAAMTAAIATVSLADGLYWVVGNRATKLARSTIGVRPKDDPRAG